MGLWDRVGLLRSHDVTLGDLLERLAAIHHDRALVEEAGDDGLRLDYDTAASTVARWAGRIRARATSGERVVIALPNGYAVFLASLAACRAGGIAVPVNAKMREHEIDHVVEDSGAALVVRDVADLDGGEPAGAAPAVPDDLAALFYTSGTTGRPKGAELTHQALIGRATNGALYPSRWRSDEVVSGLPVAHIAGFSLMLQCACLGIPVYLLRAFRPDTALDAIERRHATIFVGVPAMYRMMEEAGADERDLSSVRLWASGADVMPFALARRFQRRGATARLPVVGRDVGEAAFVDGYGMVELAGGAAMKLLPPGLPLPVKGLLGVPMPGYRLKVVDDEGNEVERGEIGELAVRGPGVMRGYHGQEDATREVLTPDGWVRTGDLVRRGRLGLLEFAGRKKDVIKHGDYSVFAAEVEAALEEHPDVVEAAVVGLPDDRKGEVPVAAVRCRDGAGVTADELCGWAAERLADYKTPQRILVVDELPRTGTDKVRKADVRGLFEEAS